MISAGSRPNSEQYSSSIALRRAVSLRFCSGVSPGLKAAKFQESAYSAATCSVFGPHAARVNGGLGFCTGAGPMFAFWTR